MGCLFLIIMGLWAAFAIYGMFMAFTALVGMPTWAAVLVIILMIVVTWLLGDG